MRWVGGRDGPFHDGRGWQVLVRMVPDGILVAGRVRASAVVREAGGVRSRAAVSGGAG